MSILSTLQTAVAQAVQQAYGTETDAAAVQINATPAEFSGDYTAVIFPFVKIAKKAPEAVGTEIGQFVQAAVPEVAGFNVIKGFLNFELGPTYWLGFLDSMLANPKFGQQPYHGRRVMIEYSSPNTNKPLHLGHVRNCLLGWSCCKLYEAIGYDVVKVQIVNDRGVAICKSMLAWQRYSGGATPASTGIKSDHFVGDYYVMFERKSQEEYKEWQKTDAAAAIFEQRKKTELDPAAFFKEYKNFWFNNHSQLGADVREMLLKWEANDPDTINLWKQLNGWVYEGFETTYKRLGVAFDKLYYESNTYLLGKDIVEDGLKKGVFFRKPDNSVWIDLTDAGFDEKVILRSDGTSVYITQDLGTARMRYEDFPSEKVVYVVADEQNYHFQVLFKTIERLGEPYAAGLHHLSYGLVELPTGRMKTREGTVVDADDLMDEVVRVAFNEAATRGEIAALPEATQQEIIEKIGLAAMKFNIIKVNPAKKMIFLPEEAVELTGQTGPFIQYAYVRTRGLGQRVVQEQISLREYVDYTDIKAPERELLQILHGFPETVQAAALQYDPSQVANYCYSLAKSYNRFWHELKVIGAENAAARAFRLRISAAVGQVLETGMQLLGIEMPERM
jgi:arginyl-tRNA synthetase